MSWNSQKISDDHSRKKRESRVKIRLRYSKKLQVSSSEQMTLGVIVVRPSSYNVHHPQYFTKKSSKSSASIVSTVTSITRLNEGPSETNFNMSSIFLGSPWITISTVRSGKFLTQPLTPTWWARVTVKCRYPTFCTFPFTIMCFVIKMRSIISQQYAGFFAWPTTKNRSRRSGRRILFCYDNEIR